MPCGALHFHTDQLQLQVSALQRGAGDNKAPGIVQRGGNNLPQRPDRNPDGEYLPAASGAADDAGELGCEGHFMHSSSR